MNPGILPMNSKDFLKMKVCDHSISLLKQLQKGRFCALILFLGLWCQSGLSKTGFVDTIFEFQGHSVYIAARNHDGRIENKEPIPVLMAIHGSGRSALNYCPDGDKGIPFYVYQRDIALQNGYMFVVVSNGKDTWGTDRGLHRLVGIYMYVREHFNTEKKWTLWATSAGGLQMYRMIREYPEKVDKALGTFPVYDLMEAYEKRKSKNFVWKDPKEFVEVNPAFFPESLTSIPVLIFHGRDDEAVPYKLHSLKLREEVNALGGKVELVIVKGGHSTSNWAMYQKDKINQFLSNQD